MPRTFKAVSFLVTPLMGADGEVYAIGQGAIAVGGFDIQGDAAKISRGVPTQGRISNGAIVERELQFKLADLTSVRLVAAQPRLHHLAPNRPCHQRSLWLARSPSRPTPRLCAYRCRPNSGANIVDLLTDVEQLIVEPDLPAKVVVDEATGIIVMGQEVRVSTVAVAQGNLTVMITESPQVSQPQAFANGQTVVTPQTQIQVADGKEHQLAVVRSGVTLQELVDGLNALGLGPRDLISILQAIKAAGALQADVQVM